MFFKTLHSTRPLKAVSKRISICREKILFALSAPKLNPTTCSFGLRLIVSNNLINNNTYGRILKASLSWTRKKSISSDAKIFVCDYILLFLHLKLNFRHSTSSFIRLRKGVEPRINFVIKWQNFAQVGLQLKFAFRIWPSGAQPGLC